MISVAGRRLTAAYSSQASHVALVEHASENLRGRGIALVGDSTTRLLHEQLSDLDADPWLTNFSAGGSIVAEWYYLLREGLHRPNDVKQVLAAFVFPCTRLMSNFQTNSYLPFLMNWNDVYTDWRGGYLTTTAAERLLFLTALPMLHSKDEIMARILDDNFQSLHPAMREILQAEGVKASKRIDSGNPNPDRHKDLHRFVQFARDRNLKLTFVHNPVSSAERTPENNACVAQYLEECRAEGLDCRDLSAALPDNAFENDRVHVRRVSLPAFRALLSSNFIPQAASKP